jgi:uncharacterized protein (DUF697 family)
LNKILEVLGAGKDAQENRAEGIRLCVRVGSAAPRPLVLAVKDLLVADDRGAEVDVALAGSGAPTSADAAIIVCGNAEADAATSALGFARANVPVALVAETAVEAPEVELPEEAEGLVSVIACADPSKLGPLLADWLVSATPKGIAMAANFPFCRDAEVKQLVVRCAAENAAVGAVNLIPGSDMPVMTANQSKLALDIAAAYGRGLDASRAVEIAAIVAAGFAWRSLSRNVVELVPAGKWVLRGVLGYVGTVAVGNGLKLRFGIEDGTVELPDFASLGKSSKEASGALAALPRRAQDAAKKAHEEREARERAQYVIFSADGTVSQGA